jgi:hypothetical protein
MLGEAFRQWQKDWDSYDKGIGDKPKSYDEFISPFIELEKEQIINAYYGLPVDNDALLPVDNKAEQYYNQTYNQNELPKTYINSVEVISYNNNSVTTNGEWNLKANYTNK